MNNTHIEVAQELADLLETDYLSYYERLCNLENLYNKSIIKKIIDYPLYDTYYGNQLHALIYVTGTLEESVSEPIYGVYTSVPEEYGIKIFKKLLEYNINLYQINYYNENILQNINCDYAIARRINNTRFKKMLHDIIVSNFIECLESE